MELITSVLQASFSLMAEFSHLFWTVLINFCHPPTYTDGLAPSRNLDIGFLHYVSSCKTANKPSDNIDLTYQGEQGFSISELWDPLTCLLNRATWVTLVALEYFLPFPRLYPCQSQNATESLLETLIALFSFPHIGCISSACIQRIEKSRIEQKI